MIESAESTPEDYKSTKARNSLPRADMEGAREHRTGMVATPPRGGDGSIPLQQFSGVS